MIDDYVQLSESDLEPIGDGYVPLNPEDVVSYSADDLRSQLREGMRDDSFGVDDFLYEAGVGARQGIASIGDQVGGALSYVGLDQYGQPLSAASRKYADDLGNFADSVGGTSTAGQFTRWLTGQAANQIPTLIGGGALAAAKGTVAGLRGLAGLSGLQSLGGTQSEATAALEAQGLDRETAVGGARLPAVLAGAITFGLTRAFPQGVENLITRFSRGEISRAGLVTALKEGIFEGAKEIPEEFTDEALQGLLAQATYDPERTLKEIALSATEAGGLGGVMGVGIGAGGALFSSRGEREGFIGPNQPPAWQRTRDDSTVGDWNAADFNTPFESNLAAPVSEELPPPTPLPRSAEVPTAPRAPIGSYFQPVDESEIESFSEMPSVDPENEKMGMRLLSRVMGEPEPDYTEGVRRVTAADVRAPVIQPAVPPVIPPQEVAPIAVQEEVAVANDPMAAQPSDSIDPFEASLPQRASLPASIPVERASISSFEDQAEIKRQRAYAKELESKNQEAKSADTVFSKLVDLVGNKLSPNSEQGKSLLEDIKRDLHNPESRSPSMSDLQNLVNNDWWNKRLLAELGDDVIPLLSEAQKLIKRQAQRSTLEFVEDIGERFADGRLKPLSPVEQLSEEQLSEEVYDRGISTLKRRGQKEKASTEELRSRVALERAKDKARYEAAIESQRPSSVSAVFIDANKVSLPVGYVRVGDRYVLNPSKDRASVGAVGWDSFETSTGPVGSASGIPAIRTLIDNSNLSADAKFVAHKILDVAAKSGLDTSAFGLELSNSLPGGRAGSVTDSLIRMIESADATVLPHEVAHMLKLMMPAKDLAALSAARLANMPIDAPESVRSGTMTSQEFIDAKLPLEMYPFINDDEYLAGFFDKKFATDQLAKRDAGLLKRIQNWLKELWEAVKSKFRDPAAMDRIYRDMVAGKYKVTPETAVQVQGERAAFETSGREAAAKANLAKTAADQKMLGEEYTVQAETPAAIMASAGLAGLPFRQREKFFFNDLLKIADEGARLNPNQNAQQVMAAQTPEVQEMLAGQAALHVRELEHRFDELIKDGDKAATELQSQSTARLINRAQTKATELQMAQTAKANTQAAIQTAINQATAALKIEAVSDQEIARLESELKAINGVGQSTVAMDKLLTDVVSVMTSSPQLVNVLRTGTARQIASEYRAVKQAANQPIQNDDLLRVGSFLLNRNSDLRDALLFAHYAKNQALAAQANVAIRGLIQRLKKNPGATIESLMRQRERRVKNAVEAEFLFNEMQDKVTEVLEDFYRRIEAGRLAQTIRSRPDWTAYKNEMYRIAKHQAGDPVSPFKKGSVVLKLPLSGREVAIGANYISDSTAEVSKKVREWAEAMTDYQMWLDDPINKAGDPAVYRQREQESEVLEDYFNASLLGTGQKSPAWLSGFSQLKSVVDNSGSRAAASARTALGKLDRADNRVGLWIQPTRTKLAQSQRDARASHNLGDMDTAEGVARYNQIVFQELASLNQKPNGPKVGDRLMSGEIVTADDMAYVRDVAEASKRLLDLIDSQKRVTLEEQRGREKGPKVFRGPLATSALTMPRAPDFDIVKALDITAVSEAFTAYSKAPNQNTVAALSAALERIWGRHGKFLVNERSSDYAKPTIFDGVGGAFSVLADQIRNNQNAFPTFDSFVNGLTQFTSKTVDEIREDVASEFGRIVQKFQEEFTPEEETDERRVGGDPSNFFTKGRSRLLAPSSFYRTGWTTDDDIKAAGGAAISTFVKDVIDGLTQIEADLARQRGDLKTKADQSKAISAKQSEQRNGDAYSDWVDIDQKINMVTTAKNDLLNAKILGDDSGWHRIGGALISGAVGNSITTIRNMASIYPARAMKNVGGSWATAWIGGFGFQKVHTARIARNLIYSIGKGGLRALMNLSDAGMAILKERSLREAWKQLFNGVLDAIGKENSELLQSFRAMKADGSYDTPDHQQIFNNRLADMTYAGGLPSSKASGKTKAGYRVAAILENSILPIVNAMFPQVGDVGTNTNIHIVENSDIGVNAVYGKKLRLLRDDLKRSGGYRKFDLKNFNSPDNLFSAKEIGITKTQLADIRRTFQWMGRSFDAKAAEYFARLNQDPNAQFLSAQDISKLVEYEINLANRKSYSNTILGNNRSPLVRNFITPLLHWNMRQFAEFASMVSVPVEGQSKVSSEEQLRNAKLVAWGLTAIATIVQLGTAGALSAAWDDWMARLFRYQLYNQVSQNKQLWEYDALSIEQGQRVSALAMESVPFMSWVSTYLLPQNTPARASSEPSLFFANKITEAINGLAYIGKTGDVAGGAFNFAKGILPQDIKTVTQRLDSQEGKAERSVMLNLMKRFGPNDIKRGADNFRTANPNLSELTPIGPRMVNTVFAGSDDEIKAQFEEAIDTATRLKRKEPRETAIQLFRSANPVLIAFKQLPTQQQFDKMVADMREDQRAQFLAAKGKIEHAAEVLKLSAPTFWKEPEPVSSFRNQSPFRDSGRQGLREVRAR